ncbi:MAG: hypothetical protein II309_05815 [Bacilli bacterium]|nr:hypothetical protein [Bacilli bacterium]
MKEKTILDINKVFFERKLEGLNAEKEKDLELKKYVYNDRVTLETDGETAKLSGGEYLIEFEKFNDLHQLFQMANFKPNKSREYRRTIYNLNNCKLYIESWPLIPTMVKVIAPSNDELEEIFKLLNMANKTTTYNINNIYEEIYGIEVSEIDNLRF